MTGQIYVEADALHAFIAGVLQGVDVPEEQAHDAADVLVWANRHGVDTHGVRNLNRIYVPRILNGMIDPKAQFRVEYGTPLSARTDGGNGLGMAGGVWAMRLAMDKARQSGVGMVTMRNSHHFGAAGYYPALALSEDLIGVATTGFLFGPEAEMGVRPTFSARPRLSTNPISIAFPTGDEPAFLLDMATSVVPMNRMMLMDELGRAIPLDWGGLDAEGNPTTDPAAVKQLLPLGGSRAGGSHKGYGLGVMVEVLGALLSGGWFEEEGEYRQERDAHFFAAFGVDLFRPLADFKAGMDAMVRSLRASQPEVGQERVYVAGEQEWETAAARQETGIPLAANVVADLQALSEEYGVEIALEEREA